MQIDINVVIAILSIIIPTVVGIILSKRQGIFKKVDLHFYPSDPHVVDRYKKYRDSTWFVINSCELPDAGNNKLLIYLPITLINKGNVAAENVVISFQYDSAYSTESFDGIYDYKKDYSSMPKRFHQNVPQGAQTMVEFQMIPPKGVTSFFEVFTFRPSFLQKKITDIEKQLFSTDKDDIAILHVRYSITAKNVDEPMYGFFWLISTMESDIQVFLDKEQEHVKKLLWVSDEKYQRLKNKRVFVPWPHKFFFNLFYSKLRVYYNVVFKQVKGYSVVEDSKKRAHSAEALELSEMDGAIIEVPFVFPSKP